jgi:hypothetical protein
MTRAAFRPEHRIPLHELQEMERFDLPRVSLLADQLRRVIAALRLAYTDIDELHALSERLIESERKAHAQLRHARIFTHPLTAWTCPECKCFNGEERATIANCRRCNHPRPTLPAPPPPTHEE